MSGYEADRGVYTTENKNSNLKLNTNDTGGGRVFFREMKASPLYAVKVNTADLLDFIKKNPHAMESLGTALFLKPYADIDKAYDTEEARALNEVSDYTRAREAFEELFNEDMIALSGCGYSSKKEKYINSFHFVCNGGELYADPLEIKEIIKDELPDYKELGYDLAVYHKAGTPSGMRAPYAVKKGENRRLELVEGIEGGRLITKDMVSNDLYECMLITTAEHGEIANTRPAEVKNTDININKLFEAVPVLKHEAGAHTIKDISEAETDEGLMKTYKLKRLTPTLCHLCERLHEADNTLFILQFANGAKLAGCWKQKQEAEIKGESARYISLTAGNATYADKVKFYIKTANENRQAIQQREAEELTEKLNILGADIINTKEAFCSNIKEFMEEQSKPNPTYDIIAIKSGLGTGKTTANSKVITGLISDDEEIAELTRGTIKKNAGEIVEKLKNNPLARDIIEKHKDNPAEAVLQLKQIPRFKSIVSSYRRTLASDYKSKYPLNADYRDEPKGKLKKRNLTIQADSFYRIPISREPINKLVIDEADQFVKHLTSDTFKKSRNNKNNWEIVKYVIGTAKQIIVMSGTIKADDVEFFQNIRRECGREAKTLFINNDISAAAEITKTWRNIHIKTGNIGEAYEQIVKLRSEGKKVLVPANIGKRRLRALAKMLKRDKHRVLLITGETNKTGEVLGAMADEYKKWAEYDVVIYSPAITGGLDYYHKGVFHNIVAVACNKTNMSGDFYQMLGRIRHPIDRNIYLFYRNYNTATIESETQYLRQLSASLNDRQKRDEIATLANWTYGQYGAVNVVANDYIKLLAKNKVEQNKDARHWIQNLIKYFILANYEINDLNEPDASYPTIEEAIIAEAVIKKEDAKTLFEARNITDAEYNEMKKNKEGKEWTPTEEAEFKKARIKREMLKPISNTLEIADEPANSLFYKIFDDDRLRAYIWNYRPYNKNVEDKLSEGLNYIKQREQNRDEKNRLITDEQGNPTDCGVMEYTFNTINTERRYNKHINLIQLIGGLGIKDIWDFKANISAEHLKETIKRQEWLAKADELVLYTTDTKKQKKIIDHMNTTTNKTFLRDTLYFINSALKAEWGVSIIATNKHATYYQLAPNKTLGAMFKKEGELKKINGWPYLGE